MRRKISLYIADQLVDLDQQSLVQLNYTMEDLSNPTVVKNSYSRSINLSATAANNRIFGDIWRSDRQTLYGGGYHGAFFNASRKTPFTIFNEMGEVLEEGYCKLTKITRKHGIPDSYSLTLYGGLGAFFYALSYDEDGNKKTLADLKYTGPNATETELNFNITKEAVDNAWKRMRGIGQQGIWDILNFAMAYNGKPSGDFDADKAVIEPDTMDMEIPSGYSTQYGFATVKLKKGYTDLEAHDLRSYLQRPVIKFSKIIDAICQDYNNGGYEVELDADFFNSGNPYYKDVYMTLPIINTLSPGTQEDEGELRMASGYDEVPGGGNPSTMYNLHIQFYPKIYLASSPSGPVYMHSSGYGGYYMTWVTYLIEFLDSDNTVIHSETVNVSSRGQLGSSPAIDLIGHFNADGSWAGGPVAVDFEALGIYAVRVTYNEHATKFGTSQGSPDPTDDMVWPDTNDFDSYIHVVWDIFAPSGESTYSYHSGESSRSGALITKKSLLSSDRTPADYLLAYCKMFGLVFKYDKGMRKVSILTRKNFYRNEVVDLTGRVDLSQQISIVPFAFDSKWYSFSPEVRGEFADYYKNLYGRPSGEQRVNTSFEFNAETKNLINGIALKGAAEVLESSRHYASIEQSSKPYPTVFLDGGEYSLLGTDGKLEDFTLPLPNVNASVSYWNNAHKGYDLFPKPQFHGKDNEADDERDTLLLYAGTMRCGDMKVAITDDLPTMLLINDNKPCWILNAIPSGLGILADYIPMFTRNEYLNGDITKTLDFGVPFEVSIPDITYSDGATLYEQYWKKYIEDRYDDDSRVMTCKVDLSGMQVSEELLRNFYYFDGAIWAMNKISNYSLTTYGDTECEFVKVQDIDNYLT